MADLVSIKIAFLNILGTFAIQTRSNNDLWWMKADGAVQLFLQEMGEAMDQEKWPTLFIFKMPNHGPEFWKGLPLLRVYLNWNTGHFNTHMLQKSTFDLFSVSSDCHLISNTAQPVRRNSCRYPATPPQDSEDTARKLFSLRESQDKVNHSLQPLDALFENLLHHN